MSDEEKKAIERLIIYKDKIKDELYPIIDFEEEKAIGIILNLIEKQSKEIEELKAISEYREKIIKGLGLKTLPKTITGFRELIENNDKKWKDKIKVEIEELKNMKVDGEVFTTSVNYAIKILQSLLEKE